jgi:hypothetical protein
MTNADRVAEAERAPTPREWSRMTVLPEKRDIFSRDLYFREGWTDLIGILGHAAVDTLGSLAMLVFKPDAVVGRRMRGTLDFVVEQGFTPIAVAPVQFTRHSMREVWRYNWHTYTIDRLEFCNLLYGSAETLMLVLRDSRPSGVVPSAVRLSELKGSAAPEGRNATHLRTYLSPPNRIINFVHVCDEPADIVRELGILLDRPQRRRLLTDVKGGSSMGIDSALSESISRLESRYPAHDFDWGRSVRRAEASGVVGGPGIAKLQEAAEVGPKLRWDELCSIIDPSDTNVDIWDFICIASGVLDHDRVGFSDLLPSVGTGDWSGSSDGSPEGSR